VALVAALVVLPAVAAMMLPWRPGLPNADVALVLVVAVVAIAANGHRGAGILAAASAAVWFDFFWTTPYETFTIDTERNVDATVLLLVVGAAVSELASRGRRAHRAELGESALLAGVATTADLVASDVPIEDLIGNVEEQLTRFLELRGVTFQRETPTGHPPSLDEAGGMRWGDMSWNVEKYGMPDEPLALPVRGRGETLAWFVLRPRPRTVPSIQARQTAGVLAAQVGAALARHPAWHA
jgi:hypothetical protein